MTLEVASIDRVSEEEAARRIEEALLQSTRRSVAQARRHDAARRRLREARRMVLSIAHHQGMFRLPADLERVALMLDWWAPGGGRPDTGRAFREIVLQLDREGLIVEIEDDGRLVGYGLSDAGRRELLGP
ncbi:MAG: hypothetical protein NZ533_11555 [Casimicrobiaceae bacterium]|nr:hypothetical protein [Casimicrobiaceae bacterium]